MVSAYCSPKKGFDSTTDGVDFDTARMERRTDFIIVGFMVSCCLVRLVVEKNFPTGKTRLQWFRIMKFIFQLLTLRFVAHLFFNA